MDDAESDVLVWMSRPYPDRVDRGGIMEVSERMTQGRDDDGVPFSCSKIEQEGDGAIAHRLLRDVTLRQDIDAKTPFTPITA